MMSAPCSPRLTLGPILFNWPPERWRDFYYKIADESPVERVYLGDIICPKRDKLVGTYRADVINRLRQAGKTVIRSTIISIINDKDQACLDQVLAQKDTPIEANDMTAVAALAGKTPFYVGPFINVYNEDTMLSLIKKGAVHFTLPFELNGEAIKILSQTAAEHDVTTEVMVYGRAPLSVSSSCYHAKAYGCDNQGCKLICERDPDGKTVTTMDDEEFLVLNGHQTMTHTCTNLIQEIKEMAQNGITHFRLSPHTCDMVLVSQIFDDLMRHERDFDAALAKLKTFGSFGCEFSNGFYHGLPGHEWVKAA